MSNQQRTYQDESTLAADHFVDQYRLDAHILQTSVTDLYQALDVDENQTVMVEILLSSTTKKYREQFLAKMRQTAQLKHPNIVEIYQVGMTSQARPYVAHEFIEGYTLQERMIQLLNHGVPTNSLYALQLVNQLADALAAAEKEGLFHHHLSPDNIFLKYDGTVILMDLGYPETPSDIGHNGHSPDSESTAVYLSPEQRQNKTIDGRSHVYSLGVILYELLAGSRPVSSGSLWHSVRQKTTPLETARPDLAPKMYALVNRCLHKEPWRRYATLSELTAAIKETIQAQKVYVQTDAALTAVPPSHTDRSWKYLLLPIAVLLLIIGLGATAVLIRNNITPPESPAVAAIITKPATHTPNPQPTRTREAPDTAVAAAPTQEISKIQILKPLEKEKYNIGSTIVFSWTTSTQLSSGQQYAVCVTDEDGNEISVGIVSETETDGIYEIRTTMAFADEPGIYNWRVILENSQTKERINASQTNSITLVAAPTPTVTPSATATFTPQPTNTATPIPPSPLPIPPTSTPIPPTPIPPSPTPIPPTAVPPTQPPAPTQPPPPPPTNTPPPPPPVPTNTPPPPP
ncbi:MAG TPA: serine/threonine protein kinase [Anaerolineae bacterium]|nr:serine/threonine protein kinase [Anaerolineae bacterium]